jgi:hypothetical protein
MTKKFELSAYRVEEMNQKELIDVEGGAAVPWWVILALDVAAEAITGHSLSELIVAAAAKIQEASAANCTDIDGWTWTAADAHCRR